MATTTFTEGQRVVLNATGLPGKWEPAELNGCAGMYLGDSPHGYARVQFDDAPIPVLVHPESLSWDVTP